MFVLPGKKNVICFVMLAILVGLGVKEYRRGHPTNSSGAPPGLKQSLRKQSEAKAASEHTATPSANAP